MRFGLRFLFRAGIDNFWEVFQLLLLYMPRPRHSKGTKEGGQWTPSPSAMDVPTGTLSIQPAADIDDERQANPKMYKKQVTIKLGGKHHTIKRGEDGNWLLPIHLTSKIAMSIKSSDHDDAEPDENESFDIASVVVTEMLEDGYGNIPTDMIDHAAKAAVLGAYGYMLFSGTKIPSYLRKVKQWQAPVDTPATFIQLEASVRGIRTAGELRTYKHTDMDTTTGRMNNEGFLKMQLGKLNGLHPIYNPSKTYLGELPKAVSRFVERKIGWPHNNQTLMQFILDDKDPTDTDMIGPYANLCFHLLSETKPEEKLHQHALERLDSMTTTKADKEILEHIFKDRVQIMRGTASMHKNTPNIDVQAYARAIDAIAAAEGRPVGDMMQAIFKKPDWAL